MTQAEVITQLQPVFDRVFLEKVELKPDLTAKQVEEWDSLMQITLVVAVEKEFGLRFRVGEVEKTKNIGDFANLIAERLSQK